MVFRSWEKFGDGKIDPAVAIEIGGVGSHARLGRAVCAEGGHGHHAGVGKGAIAVVLPQGIAHAVIGDIDIHVAIQIEVGCNHSEGIPGEFEVDAALTGDIGEGAIAVIAVENVLGRCQAPGGRRRWESP